MSELILHHYATSPFAEKVRRMLGHKGLAWKSVTIPRWMPKPDLMPLTGGYRRTPVLQIGADIYCDSACIARAIDAVQPGPALWPAGTRGLGTALGAWADQVLFFNVVAVVFGTLADGVAPELVEDRRRMSEGAIDPRRYQADQDHLRARLRAHLFWIEHGFDDGRPFLLGQTVSYPDFCVCAPLWMLQRVAELKPLQDMPRTREWLARMDALGHGRPEALDAAAALHRAAAAEPAPVTLGHEEFPAGLHAGAAVTVAPDDYGKDPVAGALVAANAQTVVVRRTDARVGTVHVHFPRAGYRVTPA
jgi:glutathione S-transferase